MSIYPDWLLSVGGGTSEVRYVADKALSFKSSAENLDFSTAQRTKTFTMTPKAMAIMAKKKTFTIAGRQTAYSFTATQVCAEV